MSSQIPSNTTQETSVATFHIPTDFYEPAIGSMQGREITLHSQQIEMSNAVQTNRSQVTRETSIPIVTVVKSQATGETAIPIATVVSPSQQPVRGMQNREVTWCTEQDEEWLCYFGGFLLGIGIIAASGYGNTGCTSKSTSPACVFSYLGIVMGLFITAVSGCCCCAKLPR